MSKRTATAAKDQQPDLLGGTAPTATKPKQDAPKTASSKGAVAKFDPKVTKRKVAKIKADHKPGTLLSIINAVIENPNVPAEKVQMFFEMQLKAEAEAQRRSFTRAKLEMRPLLPVINKDGKIEIPAKDKPGGGRTARQVTPYATFENIMDKIDRLLQQHGFDLYFTTEPTADGSRINVIGHLDHVDGHSVTTSFPLPAETSGSKNNVQGWMSALSYGKRGDTVAILNLRTRAPEDADRDGRPAPAVKGTTATQVIQDDPHAQSGGQTIEADSVELITQKQADTLVEAIEAAGKSRKDFCAAYKIKTVNDLEASLYEHALEAVRKLVKK